MMLSAVRRVGCCLNTTTTVTTMKRQRGRQQQQQDEEALMTRNQRIWLSINVSAAAAPRRREPFDWNAPTSPRQRRRRRRNPSVSMFLLVVILLGSCLRTTLAVLSSSSSRTKPRGAGPPQQQQQPPPHAVPPVASSAANDDMELLQQLVAQLTRHMSQSAALAGRFGRLRQTIFRVVSRREWYLIIKCMAASNVYWQDILLLAVLGFLPVSIVQWISGQHHVQDESSSSFGGGHGSDYKYHDSSSSMTTPRPLQSLPLVLARYTQQLAQIALLVHAVDILQMLAIGLGYVEYNDSTGIEAAALAGRSLSQFLCVTLYAAWITQQSAVLAKWLVRRRLEAKPSQFENVYSHAYAGYEQYHSAVASRRLQQVASALVYAAAIVAWLLWTVMAAASSTSMSSMPVAVAAGVGLVGLLGFASLQGLLQQVWSGVLLATSDRIDEGDVIQFAAGAADTSECDIIQGIVVQLGWTDTVIRTDDDSLLSIPNTQFAQRLVHNLSRSNFSQVQQTLRFDYREAHKLPALLKSIKDEIRLACPAVVTDGSLPFRAHWTNYKQDYLQVQVDAHFSIVPMSPEYWDNRQRVLQAINRAVKIHQVDYYGSASMTRQELGPSSSSSYQHQHYASAGSARIIHGSSRPAGSAGP